MTVASTSAPPTAPLLGVAGYDARRRVEATATGVLVPRMTGRVAPVSVAYNPTGDSNAWVWTRGRQLACRVPGDTGPHGVTAARLAGLQAALTEIDAALVVADQATLTRLIRFARQAGAEHSGFVRQLSHLRSAPSSGRLVVLTKALTRRWYTPVDADPESIDFWLVAFGAGGVAAGLRTLLADVAGGQAGGTVTAKALAAFGRGERDVVDAARFAGRRADHQVFRGLTAMSDAWSGLTRLDAGLRERNIVTGEVVRARPLSMDRGTGAVTCALTSPVYLKEGAVAMVGLDDAAGFDIDARTKLQQVSMNDDGTMTGVLAPVQGPNRNTFTIVEKALADNVAVLIADQVVLRSARGAYRYSWLDRSSTTTEASAADEASRRRDVPLDVALAGIRVAGT